MRLHQGAFRARVLLDYIERCAVCSLPRREFIEAAHTVPDRDARGRPVMPNGPTIFEGLAVPIPFREPDLPFKTTVGVLNPSLTPPKG